MSQSRTINKVNRKCMRRFLDKICCCLDMGNTIGVEEEDECYDPPPGQRLPAQRVIAQNDQGVWEERVQGGGDEQRRNLDTTQNDLVREAVAVRPAAVLERLQMHPVSTITSSDGHSGGASSSERQVESDLRWQINVTIRPKQEATATVIFAKNRWCDPRDEAQVETLARELLPSCKAYPVNLQDSAAAQTVDVLFASEREEITASDAAGGVKNNLDLGQKSWAGVLAIYPGYSEHNSLNPNDAIPDGASLAFISFDASSSSAAARVLLKVVFYGGRQHAIQEIYGVQDSLRGGNVLGDGENSLCVVCMSEERVAACLPCRHLCLCQGCAYRFRMDLEQQKCPLCRQTVNDMIQVKFIDNQLPHRNSQSSSQSDSAQDAKAKNEKEKEKDSKEEELKANVKKRLAKELLRIRRTRNDLAKEGLQIECQDENDLKLWTLKFPFATMDKKCQLALEMKRLNVDCIHLEAKIPPEFPFKPPIVRVVRPTFTRGAFYVHSFGALCMELLSATGWSPASSLEQMARQIRSMMTNCANGTIDKNKHSHVAEALQYFMLHITA